MGDSLRLDRIAAKQHGVFSLAQARSAGYGRSAVYRRVTNGQWVRLDHSAFALASAPPTWERQLAAAWVSRPGSLIGNRSAAHLLGLTDARRGRPVLVVPKGSNARSDIARIIESDQFEQLATTWIGGFPATTTPETLLSLAADLSTTDLESIFDQALLAGRLDLDSMKAILDREAGRRPRGIRALRELTKTRLPSAPMQDSSFLESMLERLLSRAAIPPWTREHSFTLLDRPARVDVYVPIWRLVVEVDGRNWHLRRADFEHDRRRDNELASRAIQVLRYTYKMVRDEPDRVIAEIETVGSLRSAQRPA